MQIPNNGGNNQYWWHTLMRLSFITPDGTEHEFRDTQTGGLVQGTNGGQTSFNPYSDTPGALSTTSNVAQTDPQQPTLSPITTVVGYDGLGRKSSTNVAGGIIETAYAYDGRGRLAYTSLPSTGTPTAECLSNGTVVSTACTPSYGTLTQFDGISRPLSVIQAGGATTCASLTGLLGPCPGAG